MKNIEKILETGKQYKFWFSDRRMGHGILDEIIDVDGETFLKVTGTDSAFTFFYLNCRTEYILRLADLSRFRRD